MKVFQIVCSFVLFFAVMLSIGWVIEGNDFFMYKFFAPKREQVRREVFEQSRAFNQGMIQELENMQFEYSAQKDPEARKALADIILHRASGYNLNDRDVPVGLREFIEGLRFQRGHSY